MSRRFQSTNTRTHRVRPRTRIRKSVEAEIRSHSNEPGSAQSVTLHDASVVRLRKVAEGNDPTDRDAAHAFLVERRRGPHRPAVHRPGLGGDERWPWEHRAPAGGPPLRGTVPRRRRPAGGDGGLPLNCFGPHTAKDEFDAAPHVIYGVRVKLAAVNPCQDNFTRGHKSTLLTHSLSELFPKHDIEC